MAHLSLDQHVIHCRMLDRDGPDTGHFPPPVADRVPRVRVYRCDRLPRRMFVALCPLSTQWRISALISMSYTVLPSWMLDRDGPDTGHLPPPVCRPRAPFAGLPL
jgi:hypothetical protein